MNYYVRIIDLETGAVEKEMGPMSERRAEKVADGVSINLDHDRFSVTVEPEESDQAAR